MKALFPCFEWLQALRGPKPLPPLNAHEEQVAALETQLQVQLVTLGSIAAEFTVPASMKVSGLHHRVAQELGLPTENQRLILGSTVLEDTESSITEFGETERLVITVLRRRRQQALTAGSSAGFLLWDLESRDFSTALGKGLEPVQCLDVSWGQLRCLAGQSCQLVLWDLGRDQEVDRYEQQGVWGLAVDWSAMKVLSASLELHLWDLKNFMPLNVVKYFAPDARCIAVDWRSGRAITCGECMTLWALDNTVSKVKDLKIGIKPCALAVNWPRCVVAGNGLQLWSIETGTSLPFRAQSEAPVLCVAAAWEAERLVSGAGDGTLRLWSIATRQVILEFQGHRSEVLSVSLHWPSGRVLSGEDSSRLKLWSFVRHPEPKAFKVEELTAPGYRGSSSCLAVDWDSEESKRSVAGRGTRNDKGNALPSLVPSSVLVTTSKALVTSSDALVTTSFRSLRRVLSL
ncbi:unnamed protein product [Durusdinium trenchii]|uniref:Ubiquitin-like domain-containing protein n=1 Tax=Durusdinium trenchii TaxID=1381693 RepID=A0ABP0JBE9_9DINO